MTSSRPFRIEGGQRVVPAQGAAIRDAEESHSRKEVGILTPPTGRLRTVAIGFTVAVLTVVFGRVICIGLGAAAKRPHRRDSSE